MSNIIDVSLDLDEKNIISIKVEKKDIVHNFKGYKIPYFIEEEKTGEQIFRAIWIRLYELLKIFDKFAEKEMGYQKSNTPHLIIRNNPQNFKLIGKYFKKVWLFPQEDKSKYYGWYISSFFLDKSNLIKCFGFNISSVTTIIKELIEIIEKNSGPISEDKSTIIGRVKSKLHKIEENKEDLKIEPFHNILKRRHLTNLTEEIEFLIEIICERKIKKLFEQESKKIFHKCIKELLQDMEKSYNEENNQENK